MGDQWPESECKQKSSSLQVFFLNHCHVNKEAQRKYRNISTTCLKKAVENYYRKLIDIGKQNIIKNTGNFLIFLFKYLQCTPFYPI